MKQIRVNKGEMSCLFFHLSLDEFEDGDEFIGLVLCVSSTWGDGEGVGCDFGLGAFATFQGIINTLHTLHWQPPSEHVSQLPGFEIHGVQEHTHTHSLSLSLSYTRTCPHCK
jgi:hypothetical protein